MQHNAMKQQMADRRNEPIFSIDPAGCKDVDDAIGLRVLDKEHSIVSIYSYQILSREDTVHLQISYSISIIVLPVV